MAFPTERTVRRTGTVLSLPVHTIQQVIVNKPMYLYAIRLSLEALFVYRSPVVRDTDELFLPIRELLNSVPHRIYRSRVVPDQDMIFGEAYETLYRLEPDD